MSYKINDGTREYVSYYVLNGPDVTFNVYRGDCLNSVYLDYIAKHRKNNMIILCFVIGWLMFPMGIGLLFMLFNLLTGNFTEMGFDGVNSYTIFVAVFMIAIMLTVFLLLLKAFRWALSMNKPPEPKDILWREGVLVDKRTSRRDRHTVRTLIIDGEHMSPITRADYFAGNRGDKYIVIYRLRNSKLVETFAIYHDLYVIEKYRSDSENI